MAQLVASRAVCIHAQQFLQLPVGGHLVRLEASEGEAEGFFRGGRVVLALGELFLAHGGEPFLLLAVRVVLISEVDEGVQHRRARWELLLLPAAQGDGVAQ